VSFRKNIPQQVSENNFIINLSSITDEIYKIADWHDFRLLFSGKIALKIEFSEFCYNKKMTMVR